MRFRKSVKIGPIRINFSKSGVGASIGVKGARITKRADGKVQATASVPGTGISSVKTFDTPASKKTKEQTAVIYSESDEQAQARYEKRLAESLENHGPRPFYHITFYADETFEKDRQNTLYLFKMRKPPYDKGFVLSLAESTEKPGLFGVYIKDALIGYVPESKAALINDEWKRIDAVSALKVLGAKGRYDAEVYVRIKKTEGQYAAEIEEFKKDFYESYKSIYFRN